MAAKKVLSLVIDLKDQASKGLRGLTGNLNPGLTRAVKAASQAMLAAGVAVAGYAVAIGKLAQRGSEILHVQSAFVGRAGDMEGSLMKLRTATEGLVGDYELMTQANMALTLGSADNVDQFATLASAAQKLGRAMGLDAAFALNSLNVGIARQSRLVLDNLGIIVDVEKANQAYAKSLGKEVDALSDSEKALAFKSAAMTQADVAIKAMGATTSNAGDMVTRFTVALKNAKDAVAKLVANSGDLNILMFEFSNVTQTIVLALESQDTELIKEAFGDLGRLAGSAFSAALLEGLSTGLQALSDIITPKFMEEWVQYVPVWGFMKSLGDVAQDGADAAWSAADAWLEAMAALRRQIEIQNQLEAKLHPPEGGGGGGGAGKATIPKDVQDRLDRLDRMNLQPVGGLQTGPQYAKGWEGYFQKWGPNDRRLPTPGIEQLPQHIEGPELGGAATDALGPWEKFRQAIQMAGYEMLQVTTNTETLAEVTGGILLNAVQDFGGAMEGVGAAAVDASTSMGEAFQNAMLGALASVARGFAQFYTAKAVAAFAEGLAGNPAAFGAAAKYLAAASMMSVVAGMAAASASGGGGGGGASGRAGKGLEGAAQSEATIIIQGGLLDMSDPKQADALADAIGQLSGRRVTIKG